jgi:phosphopantetheinyl transferase (holo-ACP synthase)
MTVLGSATEVLDVDRFVAQLDVPGSGVASASFGAEELAVAAGRSERLAARWAAKLALGAAWSSAAGSSVAQSSLAQSSLAQSSLAQSSLAQSSVAGRAPGREPPWSPGEACIALDADGRPAFVLTGRAAEAMGALGPGPVTVLVSLAHDGGVAAALVVIDGGGDGAGAALLT